MASRDINMMPEEQSGLAQSPFISAFGSSGNVTISPTETSPNWPRKPKPLGRGGVDFALRSCVDFIVLAATVPFIVLAVYAAVRDGKPVDENEWSKLQLGMRLVSCYI